MSCQAMMSQSVLNLYQHIFLNRPDLSSLSLFPSVANPNQRVSDSSSFRSLLSCFATTPVSICVVFVWPHQYLFTILQSGNVFLNTLAAWFAVLKERLCSTWKPEKSSSAFTTFWFKFLGLVVELAPKPFNFLCRCAESTYISLMLWGVLVFLISFPPPWAILKSFPYTVHNAKPSPFLDFWMNLNLLHHESLNFTIFLVFWRSWLWIVRYLFCNVSRCQFYHVIIRKLGLNINKIWCPLGGIDIE